MACHPCAEYEHFLRISNWADNFRLHKITLSLKMNFLNKQGNLRHLILNTNSNLKTPRSCHRGILNNLRMFKYFPLKFALSRPQWHYDRDESCESWPIRAQFLLQMTSDWPIRAQFLLQIDQSEDSILTWQLDIPHLLSLVMSSLSLTLSTMIRWRHMITPQPCPRLIIVLNSETVFLKYT